MVPGAEDERHGDQGGLHDEVGEPVGTFVTEGPGEKQGEHQGGGEQNGYRHRRAARSGNELLGAAVEQQGDDGGRPQASGEEMGEVGHQRRARGDTHEIEVMAGEHPLCHEQPTGDDEEGTSPPFGADDRCENSHSGREDGRDTGRFTDDADQLERVGTVARRQRHEAMSCRDAGEHRDDPGDTAATGDRCTGCDEDEEPGQRLNGPVGRVDVSRTGGHSGSHPGFGVTDGKGVGATDEMTVGRDHLPAHGPGSVRERGARCDRRRGSGGGSDVDVDGDTFTVGRDEMDLFGSRLDRFAPREGDGGGWGHQTFVSAR